MSRILRSLSRAQQLRLALGVLLLSLASLMPVLYLSLKPPKLDRNRQKWCSCEDLDTAENELATFRESIERQDAQAAEELQNGTVRIEPLQRIVRRQREIIKEQTLELQTLREAARARDLHFSRERMRRKKYTVNIIEEDEPGLWQQRTFRKHAAYGFVAYSSYRLSPSLIVVVGLGSLRERDKRRISSCHWISSTGEKTEGRLALESMNEHHWYLYELLLMNCTLPNNGTAEESGDMYISKVGGHLQVLLDQEVFYPYVEKDGYEVHKMDSMGPFRYESLYCGPPMFGTLSLPGIKQWVAYHRYHSGFEHFILYDAGAFTDDFTLAFSPLVDEGIVTIQEFKEALQYDIWAQNQALAMHDCLFRSREIARWIWFHDLDEYVEAPPHTTVPGILKKYKDEPYLTHGSYVYSMNKCEEKNVWDPQHGKYAVEMMLYRWEKPYCIKDEMDPSLCLDYYGMRKLIANPRKVQRAYIHHTALPWDGGTDLPISELWHSHFKRLIQPNRACSGEPEKSDSLKKVSTLADIAAKARLCAREGFTNVARCKPGVEP